MVKHWQERTRCWVPNHGAFGGFEREGEHARHGEREGNELREAGHKRGTPGLQIYLPVEAYPPGIPVPA